MLGGGGGGGVVRGWGVGVFRSNRKEKGNEGRGRREGTKDMREERGE